MVANHDLLLRWPPDYPRFTHVIADEAHEISGALVRLCEERGLELHEPSDADYAAIDPRLTGDVRDVLTVEGSLASRAGVGGTAPARVAEQLAELRARAATLSAGAAG